MFLFFGNLTTKSITSSFPKRRPLLILRDEPASRASRRLVGRAQEGRRSSNHRHERTRAREVRVAPARLLRVRERPNGVGRVGVSRRRAFAERMPRTGNERREAERDEKEVDRRRETEFCRGAGRDAGHPDDVSGRGGEVKTRLLPRLCARDIPLSLVLQKCALDASRTHKARPRERERERQRGVVQKTKTPITRRRRRRPRRPRRRKRDKKIKPPLLSVRQERRCGVPRQSQAKFKEEEVCF